MTNRKRTFVCCESTALVGTILFLWIIVQSVRADQVDDLIVQLKQKPKARIEVVRKLAKVEDKRATQALLKLLKLKIGNDKEREQLWYETAKALRQHASNSLLDENALPVLKRLAKTKPMITHLVAFENFHAYTYPYPEAARNMLWIVYRKVAERRIDAKLSGLNQPEKIAYLVKKAWISDKTDKTLGHMGVLTLFRHTTFWTAAQDRLKKLGVAGVQAAIARIPAASKRSQKNMIRYFSEVYQQTKDKRSLSGLWTLASSSSVQGDAIEALAKSGNKDAADAIIELVNQSKTDVSSALRSLGHLPTERAISFLISKLSDQDGSVASAAKDALERMGRPAVPALIKALKSKDQSVRMRAVSVLVKIKDKQRWDKIQDERLDKPLRDFLKQYPNERPREIQAIKDVLVEQTFDAQLAGLSQPQKIAYLVKKAWINKKPDGSDESFSPTRRSMMVAQERLRKLGVAGVQATIARIPSADTESLGDMVRYFGQVYRKTHDKRCFDALWTLANSTTSKHFDGRRQGYTTLMALSNDNKEIADAMIELIKQSKTDVDAKLYGWGFLPTERAVPLLISRLSDQGNNVAFTAEIALTHIGKPAVPALIKALKSKNQSVRMRAVSALVVIKRLDKIKDERLDKALRDFLKQYPNERPYVIQKIKDVFMEQIIDAKLAGLSQPEKIAYLVKKAWISKKTPDERNVPSMSRRSVEVAKKRLQKLGSAGVQATITRVPAVNKKLQKDMIRYFSEVHQKTKDKRCIDGLLVLAKFTHGKYVWYVDPQKDALNVLGWLGNKETADAIIELVNQSKTDVRAALWSLSWLGGERAVRLLISKLSDADQKISDIASDALACIGTPAVPGLIGAIKSENRSVRIRVLYALAKIKDPKRDKALRDFLKQYPNEDPEVTQKIQAALNDK